MEKKMLTEVFYLHEKGSLADARLCTYILDDSDSIAIEKRPMMLIREAVTSTRLTGKQSRSPCIF